MKRMDELFSISVHHGGYFTMNPRKYVGGVVDVVDNCDPEWWSKIEIKDFHLVVDDPDAMYMTKLVRGREEIHVYVEHPVDDPILIDEGKDVDEPIEVDAKQVYARRVGERPVIEKVNADITIEVAASQVGQMGTGVMNSDFENEELHSLVESSSNDELGYDTNDNSKDDKRTHVGDGRE
nr:hypothetical protein CFP56_56341 [Quercus suber]